MNSYALLDNGSDINVISEKVASNLRLKTETHDMRVESLGKVDESARKVADVTIEGLNGFSLVLEDTVYGDIVTSGKIELPTLGDVAGLDHCADVEFIDFPEDVEVHRGIGMIIGSKYAWTWSKGERRVGENNQPIAVLSCFGWGLLGPKWSSSSSRSGCCHHVTADFRKNCDNPEDELASMFAKQFEPVEEEQTGLSVEDEFAVKQMESTVRWDESVKRYRVGLPWKHGREHAARILNALDSDKMALDRLKRSANRLHRDPERRKITFETMRKFVDEGKVKPVDPAEHHKCPPHIPKWTIPIHIADKPGKPGQVRVCHDCRAPVKGICLNDFLLDGPDLGRNINGIVMRFRGGGEVALGADIRGFFHEVYITEEDERVFRYWWFTDERMTDEELNGFLGHVFGAKSSGFVATWCLRHHIQVNANRYCEDVVEAVMWNFYVDDLVISKGDVEAARSFRIRVTKALADGGFDLCKWRSSHPAALVDSPEDALPEAPEGPEPIGKILGIDYRFGADEFCFVSCAAKACKPVVNKRGLLSAMHALYDPMGFLSPFVIRARMLFQEAVLAVAGWDDKDRLPEDIIAEFAKWQAGIPDLATLTIPRWYSSPETLGSLPELHVFSDASKKAYGAVAYHREVRDGVIRNTIVCAKAHVVPLKMAAAGHFQSTPRLEMQAARLAAELMAFIIREYHGTYGKKRLHTDSQCVIKMLRNPEARLKMYFANRVSKIHALTDVEDWLYVASEDNPADDCSRGLAPTDPKWKRFHHGPEFLWRPEAEWPVHSLQARALPAEIFAVAAASTSRPSVPVAIRAVGGISGWMAKVRRLAVLARAVVDLVAWIRGGRVERGRVWGASRYAAFSIKQMAAAESALIAAVQDVSYSSEKSELMVRGVRSYDCRRVVSIPKSPLSSLSPFVDDEGVIRCGGRLGNATDLSFREKFPIILPHNSDVVVDLVRHIHEHSLHVGVDQLLSEIRRRFWVTRGRRVAKRVVSLCVTCQRMFKAPASQLMASLPAFRVSQSAPFRHTGVDVFGHFRLKIAGRAFHKVWVALFTCMAVRAVHFEVLRDLSSNSFVNALMRFRARRPGVRSLYSDNGSNFVAADKEIRSAVEEWNRSVAAELAMEGLEWSFIPPHAPHRGGVWERLVRSAKKHLSSVFQEDGFHIEVFSTVLVKAESIINSRPLTRVGDGVDSDRPLTPMHFLCPGVYLHSGDELLPPSPPDESVLRYSWKQSRALVDGFWKRWSRDYVSALQARPKWRSSEVDLVVGDVVLLVDEQVKRGSWKMGRIMDTSGSDGHVRGVSVRTADGKIFSRDRTKVVRLELDPARALPE